MKTNEEITNEIHKIAVEYCDHAVKPFIAILQPRRTFKEIPVQLLESHVNRMIDCTAIAVSMHAIDGNPVDVAENWLIEKALEDDVEYAMFIEEDTALPFYGLVNLVSTAEQNPGAIVVGVYYVKFGGPMMGKIDEKGRWTYLDVTPNTGLRRNIGFSGLGCALIPLSVIKKIKKQFPDLPLFCIIPEKCWGDEKVKAMGNDTWFYNLAKKCGVEVICDTSVQCLHVELATGKYTAHPDIDLDDYFTNFPITEKLTYKDRRRVERDYHARINLPDYINNISQPVKNLPIDYSEETEKKVIECLQDIQCTQNYYEVSRLCERLKTLKPKVILEIGVAFGGSMNLWLNFSQDDTLYIGVDNAMQFVPKKEYIQKKILIEGDSQLPDTVKKVKEALGDNKVDFLFIDGSHIASAVRSDFAIYSPFVKNGGIIALHDIDVSINQEHCKGIKEFWKELKDKYNTEEFINTESEVHFGIGVIKIGSDQ